MTTLTQTLSRTDLSALSARAAKVMRDFCKSVVQKHQQRRAVRHLSSLSDRHLKDIGIHRSEIISAVYGEDTDRAGHNNVII